MRWSRIPSRVRSRPSAAFPLETWLALAVGLERAGADWSGPLNALRWDLCGKKTTI